MMIAFLLAPAIHGQEPVSKATLGEKRREVKAYENEAKRRGHHPQDSVYAAQEFSSEAADQPAGAPATATDPPPSPSVREAARRADALGRSGHHKKAIEEYKRLLELEPEFYEAQIDITLEFERAASLDLAIRNLRRLIRSFPQHVLAFNNLATYLFQLHRFDEAETIARQALKLHPQSFKANFMLGATLMEKGQWTTEARESLQRAAARYPEAGALLAQFPR